LGVQAKTNKNDEFYTQLTDIEKEVRRYKYHFKSLLLLILCVYLKTDTFELLVRNAQYESK